MATETATKTQVIVRLHKVNFECNALKHTVYFSEQATRACKDPLQGWANPGHSKAVLADTEEEAIEKIRQQLKADIEFWMDDADLTAFSFNVAIEKVENGLFWSWFGCVTGNNFKVHEFNEWGR